MAIANSSASRGNKCYPLITTYIIDNYEFKGDLFPLFLSKLLDTRFFGSVIFAPWYAVYTKRQE